MQQGIVFNIQRYSIHDGPGIRTTVFLKGCPLNCWWCHNPESQSFKREILYFEDRCTGCGTCLQSCPEGALAFKNGSLQDEDQPGQHQPDEQERQSARAGKSEGNLTGEREAPEKARGNRQQRVLRNRDKCVLCGNCLENCPAGALEMVGRVMTAGEIIQAVEKDTIFYDQSGGGVTLSGGEPLSQFELVRELVRYFHQTGINVAIDTCGHVPWKHLREVAPGVDYFLYDLKFIDSDRHRKYTGVGNEKILDNLARLAGRGRKAVDNEQSSAEGSYEILGRIPLIPGINDDRENIEGIGRFFLKQQVLRVHLLPYHHTGIDKYSRLGKEYKLPLLKPLAEERIDYLAGLLKHLGLKVKTGG